jgi:uncharacterized protein YbjT (DUF2867 family)
MKSEGLGFWRNGKTGSAVVERDVAVGYDATAFVRDAGERSVLNVSIAQGDATNRADVDDTIRSKRSGSNCVAGHGCSPVGSLR